MKEHFGLYLILTHPVAGYEVCAKAAVDCDVLLVDDILDTGRTLVLTKKLLLERGARSVRSCVLLDKKSHRAIEFQADFKGFDIDDHFVVGYGLDYDNLYRELPHIAKVCFHD